MTNPGRDLAAMRPTTTAVCVACGKRFEARAKARKRLPAGAPLEPMAQTCSATCRSARWRDAHPEQYRAYQRAYRQRRAPSPTATGAEEGEP